MALKLGVNIDHVATLREARYRDRDAGEPSPVAAAMVCESAGADGITAHLREDRRHIQDRDVIELRRRINTRLNLEMGNSPPMPIMPIWRRRLATPNSDNTWRSYGFGVMAELASASRASARNRNSSLSR
jgi:hypothetical protein